MTPLVRATNSGSLASFLKAAKTAFASFRDPKPAFTFSIGWARDYDRLFFSDFAETTGTEALLRRALLTGRVFLCSRGGGGKTVILRRLAQHALQEKVVPILLDLKKWTAPDYELWSACGETLVPSMNFLLQQFGVPPLTLLEVDAFPLRAPRLLLVDGLNEVASKTADDLIGTLDEFVRVAAQTTVIVADRMVRRSFRHPERWQLALVKPLSVEEVELRLSSRPRRGDRASEMDAATKSLFETPFFLDEFLRENEVGLRDWFIRHASLSEQELSEAASGAFAAYASDSARTFPLQTFGAHAGPEVVAKLRSSRALIVDGNLAYFDHHLKHDYLASVHLARTPDQWNRNAFRAATFDASSFDILAMALQQLDQAQADAFVRQVYDWNPYGAAYAITETRYRHTSAVSQEMERVVLAMLAERRLDIVLATAERASDALSVFPAADALRFRGVTSLEEVFELVRAIKSQVPWFNEWLGLFTRPQGDAVRNEELPTILEGNSVLGWTFANVLKRMTVGEGQLEILRSWLEDQDNPTVRWRIAHALGAFPTVHNVASLLTRLDADSDGLVRYGATRSLVELAARADEAVRAGVFEALSQRAAGFLRDKPCLDELARVVFIRTDRAPPSWAESVLTVIRALYVATIDAEKKERWARLGHEVQSKYTT